MSYPVTRIRYLGAELPADSDIEVLFDSTLNDSIQPAADKGAGRLQGAGNRWFVYSIWHDENFAINGYFKRVLPNGTLSDWRQFYTQAVVAGALASIDEVYIEPYAHVKFELVNGGVSQTEFDPNLVLSDQRAKAT